MKILKIFGLVAGIHVFALILIFANPGCSSSTKPAPAPGDTVARSEPEPSISVPTAPAETTPARTSEVSFSPAHVTFDPNAPAVASSNGGVRFNPTRPSTAAAGALVSEPVVDVTPATTYTVVSGDNFSVIAKRTHSTVAAITAANNLKPTAILHPGQKLIIPGKPASPAAAATANPAGGGAAKATTNGSATPKPANGESFKHQVKSGETLGAIARMYGVRQGEIAIANNITDPARQVRAGMELIIPGFQAPGGRAGQKVAPDSANKSAPVVPTLNIEPEPAPAKLEIPVIKPDESPFSPAPKK